MKLRSLPARILAVVAVTAALTLAPSTAFADDFPGTGGDDNITGTNGDDTVAGQNGEDDINGDPNAEVFGGDDQIDGGDGDDVIDGDNAGVVFGGDDVIDGGDGGDDIYGDGTGVVFGGDDVIDGGADDDLIAGDGFGVGFGGDDVIHGGDGNDEINGDGSLILVGGDDELYGDAGDDELYGDGGNDLLCGGDGDDYLAGEDGIDIGCAVDDEITLNAGVPGMLDVTVNDDFLDDEGDGSADGVDEDEAPLLYRVVGSSAGIVGAAIDEITGILTFTANASGTVEYEVYRMFDDVDIIASLASVFITVPVVDEPDAPSTPAPEETALLPNTGAGDSLMQGAAALALILAGIGLLMGGRRKSDDREPEAGDTVRDDSDVQVPVMTTRHLVAVHAFELGAFRVSVGVGPREHSSLSSHPAYGRRHMEVQVV